MGKAGIFCCIFLGHFASVLAALIEHDAKLSRNFPGFFENVVPFPLESNFDFTPYEPVFGSWRSWSPDFRVLAGLPSILNVPRIQVFCEESQLSVLVDKRSYGAVMTADDIQLGGGCFSNAERPNQFVFTYSVDVCGTKHSQHNGMVTFTNSLHFNVKKPMASRWQIPSTVHISCIPKRSSVGPGFSDSLAPPTKDKSFDMNAMNPPLTSAAESNIYKRGQVINFQVSAKTGPDQQLFIHSCFVSASPEPQTKSGHAVIMNKGCTAPLGSPHPVVKFLASSGGNVVNFLLNTTYLTSELYVHCGVLVSDRGVTSGLKSCNYDLVQSRWEDLSGDVEVCECCKSKCRGPSVKYLPEDARATVSAGPFVIVDTDIEMSSEPKLTAPAPVTDSMMSDAAVTEDTIVSGTSLSGAQSSFPPQGVVVVRRNPVARLTLWLSGQVRATEHTKRIGSKSGDSLTVQLKASDVSNNLPVPQLSTSHLSPPTKDVEGKNGNEQNIDPSLLDLNLLSMVDGLPIPPQLDKAATSDESLEQNGFGRVFGTDVPQKNVPLSAEIAANDLHLVEFDQVEDALARMQADAAVMPQEGTNDVQPVIRSKLQFSKSKDGTRTLSYEEEVVKQQEGERVTRVGCGMDGIKRKLEPRQKGLRLAFLDFVRGVDEAE